MRFNRKQNLLMLIILRNRLENHLKQITLPCHWKCKNLINGTTFASFLATQCLATLAKNLEEEYSKAAKIIAIDFYMDDLMTGDNTQEEFLKLQQGISMVMSSGKLKLRKWSSNLTSILESIDNSEDDRC